MVYFLYFFRKNYKNFQKPKIGRNEKKCDDSQKQIYFSS